VPTPTTDLATIRYLLTLPGWLTLYCRAHPAEDGEGDAGPPDVSEEHIAGAWWSGHGYTITVWRHPRSAAIECIIRSNSGTPKDVRDIAPSWPRSGAEEIDKAVMWAIRTRALIEHVATTTLAVAAPPPPPTTIAELATRPGWRLDDGDAIHDQTDTIASPISVHLAGDQLWPGDERACAEAAYAVAAASEGSQARALAAATARMGQE
jgi:hypothetical protein